MSIFRITKIPQFLIIILLILFVIADSSCRRRSKTISIAKGGYKVRTASSKNASKTVRTIIAKARTLKGTPHKDGGLSSFGIDCSGLMFVAFKAAEIDIPRRAADQAKAAKKIKIDDVKPGDFVYFNTTGKGISHIGLVTEVMASEKIMFIHTSSSLGVVESNLLEKYWQKTLLGASRWDF